METLTSTLKKVISLSIIIVFICSAYFFLYLKGNKDGLPLFLPFVDNASSTVSIISSEDEVIKLLLIFSTLLFLKVLKTSKDLFQH